ncbi:MAG: MogA/MoaB family molybdenum cofactor biosynthesis protein [Candidatus Coatesbacteria bacterium]
MTPALTAAILVVSDRCSRGEAEDTTGPRLAAFLESRGWRVAALRVVPDVAGGIQAAIREWADGGVAGLILTAGGTGLGPRDVTPEATAAVLDRQADGLVFLMRAEGLKHTPRAVLSRGLAGTRKSSLVVNLPGSPAGAEESAAAIIDLVPHALAMMQGEGHAAAGGKGA